jgi:hypothetical protein
MRRQAQRSLRRENNAGRRQQRLCVCRDAGSTREDYWCRLVVATAAGIGEARSSIRPLLWTVASESSHGEALSVYCTVGQDPGGWAWA